ncbi:hypothetical protein VTO73DRAFT_3595, partial [Trametes versicolor]
MAETSVTATVHVTYLFRIYYYTPTIRARISSTNQRQCGVGARARSPRLPCTSLYALESTSFSQISSGAGHRPVTVWFVPKLASCQASNALAKPSVAVVPHGDHRPSPLLRLRTLSGASSEVAALSSTTVAAPFALHRCSLPSPYLGTASSFPSAVPARSPAATTTLA